MPEFVYRNKKGIIRVAFYSEEDQDLIEHLRWRIDADGFMRRNSTRDMFGKQQTIFFHHVVAQRMGLDTKLIIIHINGIKGDNRRSNLRSATKQQVQMSRGKHYNNKSGFKGVVKKSSKKFRAQTTINKKTITIGDFDSPEEAYRAYCDYVRPIHGEFFGSIPIWQK
ncbi:MAG: HNH endonuclease [Nostoc indistinguendum CM1-VF10]|jgi:hypothetical protein|nr:HNH endonuclease [Nostoc indistinguendum CM1-VF10]